MINAKFSADFSDFQNAVSKAETSLRGFETGAGKVETSLNRMANSLAGTRLVQDASIMAEAVERVGGVSRLTEHELARVSAQAKEAAAKLVAMGQDVPPGIQRIADATKGASAATMNWQSALLSAASAFGIAFSAQAVIGFVGRVIDAAGKIQDLASQLKVSTDAVQRWDYAIKLSGGTIDDVEQALSFMNKTLGAGGNSTREALAAAGLEFSKIRAMKPEEAFEVTVTAVSKMTDAMKQAEVQQELFGKGGKAMLAAMAEGFVETGNQASVMSEETIKRLDAAGDEWTKLGNKITIVSGEMIGSIAKMLTAWKSEDEQKYAEKWFSALHLNTTQAKADLADLGRLFDTLRGKLGTLPTPANQPAANVGAPVQLPKLSVSELLAIGDALDKERVAITGVNRAMKAAIPITAEMQHALDLLELAHQHQDAALKFQEASWRAWENTVSKALANVAKNSAPLHLVTRDLSSFTAQVDASYDGLKVHGDLVGTLPPKIHAVTDSVGDLARSLVQLSQVSGSAFGSIMQGTASIIVGLNAAQKANAQWSGSTGVASAMFSAEATGTEKWAAGMASAGAVASGAMNVWNATAAESNKAVAALKGAMGGAQAGAIFGPWGAAIGAAAGALTGFLHSMFGAAGRDLVKEFAGSFGGFDALHVELNALGAEGERLWIALTQGVGRNNPKEAQAAIDAITKALQKKADASDEAVVMSEAEAQATIETAAEAAKALDEVNERLKVNRDAWGEWSEDVTGYLQRLADDIRAMPLPTPTGAPGGSGGDGGGSNRGSGGSPRYTGGTASRGASAINITVVSQLDGREVARNTYKHLPSVLALMGR